MAAPTSKTMFNYFTKLPSKDCISDENPRKSAPIFNKQHVDEFQTSRIERFDLELADTTSTSANTYLEALRTNHHKPYRVLKKPRGPLRSRLLQFSEDVRPPYFGTWQKTSKLVSGRKPYGQDTEIFDYDVDSEAEWDIGGPGESLKGDDSEDEEELDDYEIDMKTFVPHGYVSDDEVANSDNEEHNQSANQSLELDCDQETDSNTDVKIIYECRNSTVSSANGTNELQQQNQPAPKQTPKMDIKSIILGLNFEDSPSISESKAQFLRNFQGCDCS